LKLYRYYSSIEFALDVLVNHHIYFNSVADFNDPYESVICYDRRRDDDGNPQPLKEIQYSSKTGSGIISFSTDPDSMLLWSHYANGHKGVCICFDFPLQENTDGFYTVEGSWPNVLFRKLDYGIDLQCLDADGGFSMGGGEWCRVLSNKPKEWEYEREVRAFSIGQERVRLAIQPQWISGLLLGLRCNEATLSLMKRIAQDSENPFTVEKMDVNPKAIGLIRKTMEVEPTKAKGRRK